MISCILLSAGLSSRFGSPKALVSLDRSSSTVLIEDLQHLLIQVPIIDEIIVVLGAEQEKIKPFLFKHNRIKVVYNKDYILGQTSSFKKGLEYLSPSSDGIMLFPVDYPFIRQETLLQLCALFMEQKPDILIPTYHGQKGHPPIFSIKLKEEFLGLPNDAGINMLIHSYSGPTRFVPVEDAGIIKTFNTPEELEKIKGPNF
ncbi:MAG: nucleotidyltransferase family protein [Candidatus Omnitrophica bacterium]|nr:nucleotidyltransferase family protein [Candidatus Omnitrophota bacterium]